MKLTKGQETHALVSGYVFYAANQCLQGYASSNPNLRRALDYAMAFEGALFPAVIIEQTDEIVEYAKQFGTKFQLDQEN